ncbi:uncharacterized protein LOC135809915 isoform X2 [Sycon ciliatum]|uniref:uncharacterized protein LOC135809915 isoform X2 n=1 Tax=Sycon ciliatum TaxID=27933 RepID=UPI0031F61BA7
MEHFLHCLLPILGLILSFRLAAASPAANGIAKPIGSLLYEANFTDPRLGVVIAVYCAIPEGSSNTGCDVKLKHGRFVVKQQMFPGGLSFLNITSAEMKVGLYQIIFRQSTRSSDRITVHYTVSPVSRDGMDSGNLTLSGELVLRSCAESDCPSEWCRQTVGCVPRNALPGIEPLSCGYAFHTTTTVQCNYSTFGTPADPAAVNYVIAVDVDHDGDCQPGDLYLYDTGQENATLLRFSCNSLYGGTLKQPQCQVQASAGRIVIGGLPQDKEFRIRFEASFNTGPPRDYTKTVYEPSQAFCPGANRDEKAVWSDAACAPCQTQPQTRRVLNYTCLGSPSWPSDLTQQCSCVNSTQHHTNLTLCPQANTNLTELLHCAQQQQNNTGRQPLVLTVCLLVGALAITVIGFWLFRALKQPLAIASCKDQIVTSMGRTVYLTYIYHPSMKNVKAFKSAANKAIVKRMSHECVWRWNVSEILIVFASEDLVKPYIQLLPQSDKIDRQHLYKSLLACRQALDAPSDGLVILDHNQDEMGPKCQELFLDDDKHPDIFWLDYKNKRAPGADVINRFTTKLLELQPSDKPTYQMHIQSDYLLTEVMIKPTAVIGNFLVTFHGNKWSVDGQEYHGRLTVEFADATLAKRLEGLSEEVQGRTSMRLRPLDIFLVPVSPGCREAWSQPPALMRCYRRNPERPCITVIIHPKDSCQEVLTCQDIRDLGLSLTIGYEGDTWPPQHSEHADDLAESIYDATAGFISSNQAQYCISSADISIQDAQSTRLPHEQLPLSRPGDGCHLPPGASVPVPAPDDDEEEEDAAAAAADDDEAVPNDDGEENADSAADPGRRSVGSGCNSSSATSCTDTHVDTNSEFDSSV